MSPTANLESRSWQSFAANASIILVGCRGSGKKSLGFIAATHLKRRFITEDHYFQQVTGLTRAECVTGHGSEEFYQKSINVLSQMLSNNQTDSVIECGMGSLTDAAQVILRKYTKTNPVIYVMRERLHIRNLLNLDEIDSRRLEIADLTHRTCSNFEYYNVFDETGGAKMDEAHHITYSSQNISFRLKHAKRDFCQFVDSIWDSTNTKAQLWTSPFSITKVLPDKRPHTHAIVALMSELKEERFRLEELESGGDAIELVVDDFSAEMFQNLAKQTALIRRNVGLPIIMNPRISNAQGENELHYRQILTQGLRLAMEYLIIDLDCPAEFISRIILHKGRTKIIGELTLGSSSSDGWLSPSRMKFYQKGKSLGCDIIRLVQVTKSPKDEDELREFLRIVTEQAEPRPILIAYNLGSRRQESVIFNPTLTPVSHPLLQNKLDLLTSQETMQQLFAANLLDPLRHYVVGNTVSYSLSPALHQAAYRTCGLSHKFEVREASSMEDVEKLFQSPEFGGASITHPLKVETCKMVEHKSPHAAAIGAVNCLLPLHAADDGSVLPLESQPNQRNHRASVVGWYGENVDWEAISTGLKKNLSPRNATHISKASGLVIGAGGVARAAIYALLTLGCRNIVIYNRTTARAELLAQYYNGMIKEIAGGKQVVSVLKSLQDPWPSTHKPATMIIACIPAHSISGQSVANFEMPAHWLTSPSGGVLMELAYEPVITPLLKQVKQIRCETGQPWVLVDGIELLIEQASLQFELMTGRRAPRRQMRLEMEHLCKEKGPRINDQ